MRPSHRASLDPAFALAVPGVVAEVEHGTSAEVVVVVHPPRSTLGSGAALGGLTGGLLALAGCLWSSVEVSEPGVMFIVTVAAVVSGLAAHVAQDRWTPLEVRHARSVRRAQAAFVGLGVHRTRERTGVVVLLDEAEGRVALVYDTGVEGAVARGTLDGVRYGDGPDGRCLAGLQPVLDGLRELGRLLASGLPADPTDNPEELSNHPRVWS